MPLQRWRRTTNSMRPWVCYRSNRTPSDTIGQWPGWCFLTWWKFERKRKPCSSMWTWLQQDLRTARSFWEKREEYWQSTPRNHRRQLWRWEFHDLYLQMFQSRERKLHWDGFWIVPSRRQMMQRSDIRDCGRMWSCASRSRKCFRASGRR